MKLRTVLSKANSILTYPRRRKEEKLYRQWIKSTDLPPEAIPRREVTEDIKPEPDKKEPYLPPEAIPYEEVAKDVTPKSGKKQLRQDTAYILLAISIVLFCISLIILISQAC